MADRARPAWEAVTRHGIFFSCAGREKKKDRDSPREPKRWMGEGGTITWRPPIPPLGGLFSIRQKEEGRRQCPTCTSRISEGRSAPACTSNFFPHPANSCAPPQRAQGTRVALRASPPPTQPPQHRPPAALPSRRARTDGSSPIGFAADPFAALSGPVTALGRKDFHKPAWSRRVAARDCVRVAAPLSLSAPRAPVPLAGRTSGQDDGVCGFYPRHEGQGDNLSQLQRGRADELRRTLQWARAGGGGQ